MNEIAQPEIAPKPPLKKTPEKKCGVTCLSIHNRPLEKIDSYDFPLANKAPEANERESCAKRLVPQNLGDSVDAPFRDPELSISVDR